MPGPRILRRSLLLAALLAAGACSQAPAPRCGRLFVDGVVHTGRGVERAAVAVTDGRIAAVVPEAEVGPWRQAAGEVVDLHGAHVYPGFTESHGHYAGYGMALEQVDLGGAASYEEVIERVRAAAAALPAGSWVMGRGWDQNLWPDKAFPTQAKLSAAVPDHPVLLRRVDGHAVLTNAAGLAAAGITAATPEPAGGRIFREPDGSPTGVLVDTAAALVERVIPAETAADIERRVLLAGRKLTELGFTEIHDAGTSRATLRVLRRLESEHRLPLRVYVMLDGTDDGLLDAELPAGPSTSPDGMLTVRAVKLYADGALGSRGAWLSAPYSDDPSTSGTEVTSEARLAEVVGRAGEAGFQPCIHAIGDAAVTRVLDIFQRELGDRSRELRPRVEHAQIVRPEDVPRFAAIGAIASVQPTHCTSDMPWAPSRLAQARVAWSYRWRSLLDAGARLCFGSDVPVENPDPRRTLWSAVTRRPEDGAGPAGGWNPAERLTRHEAVEGYTSWAAYAAFEESRRGAVAPGYAADLTIFDRDLEAGTPEEARQAVVLRTVVAGRDAYVGRTGS